MTTQFHEGQDVEVLIRAEIFHSGICTTDWRDATIVGNHWSTEEIAEGAREDIYDVQFTDGSRSVFDAEHIRAVRSAMKSDGTAAQLWPNPPESTTGSGWSS